ncbi:unnamed protein product, partial [Prorocentrum cordatum]
SAATGSVACASWSREGRELPRDPIPQTPAAEEPEAVAAGLARERAAREEDAARCPPLALQLALLTRQEERGRWRRWRSCGCRGPGRRCCARRSGSRHRRPGGR